MRQHDHTGQEFLEFLILAGTSDIQDNDEPWVHAQKLMPFDLAIERGIACQAVAAAVAGHALKAITCFTKLLLSTQTVQQGTMDLSDASARQTQQQLLILVGIALKNARLAAWASLKMAEILDLPSTVTHRYILQALDRMATMTGIVKAIKRQSGTEVVAAWQHQQMC